MTDSDTKVGHCTVHTCDEPATRLLQWPEPGGLEASFCDDHAEQKLALTQVSEVDYAE